MEDKKTVSIEHDPQEDVYKITFTWPKKVEVICTIKHLEDLKSEIERIEKELSA